MKRFGFFLPVFLITIFLCACQPREVVIVVTATPEPDKTIAPKIATTIPPTATEIKYTPTPTIPPDKRQLFLTAKLAGISYFENGSYPGAIEAAKELGYELNILSPGEWSPSEQKHIIDDVISAGEVDAILVSAQDPKVLCSSLNKAMKQGIVVVSWDSDTNCRQLFQNHINAEEFGRSLTQMMCEIQGGPFFCKGKIALLSINASNQKSWVNWAKEEWQKPEYEGMQLVEVLIGYDTYDSGYNLAKTLMAKYPDLQGIIVPAAGSITGAAALIEDMGLSDQIKVTGFGLPNDLRGFVKNGTIPQFALWNPSDQAYLAVYMAHALLRGEIRGETNEVFSAGRLGQYKIGENGEVLLGPPFIFDSTNVDNFNF